MLVYENDANGYYFDGDNHKSSFGEITDTENPCFQSWLMTKVLNIPIIQKTQRRNQTYTELKICFHSIISWRRVTTILFLTSLNYTLRTKMLVVITILLEIAWCMVRGGNT